MNLRTYHVISFAHVTTNIICHVTLFRPLFYSDYVAISSGYSVVEIVQLQLAIIGFPWWTTKCKMKSNQLNRCQTAQEQFWVREFMPLRSYYPCKCLIDDSISYWWHLFFFLNDSFIMLNNYFILWMVFMNIGFLKFTVSELIKGKLHYSTMFLP